MLRTLTQAIGVLLLSQAAFAEEGFHGYVFGGVGFTDASSNTVKGNPLIDIGNTTINSLGRSPQSQDDVAPAFNFEFSYGFDNGLEVYAGTTLEDLVRFDTTSSLGVRGGHADTGQFAAAVVFTPIVTEVWEDPYLTGAARRDTKRESTGIRLSWEEIMGSGLGVVLTVREIELDDELSGTDPALGLTDREIRLLDREGDQVNLRVEYKFKLDERQTLVPALVFRDRDRDGAAEAADGTGAQLTYSLMGEGVSFFGNFYYLSQDFDRTNPIFGRDRDENIFGVQGSLFVPAKWIGDRWNWQVNLAYGEAYSDVDFYDSDVFSFSVGLITRW